MQANSNFRVNYAGVTSEGSSYSDPFDPAQVQRILSARTRTRSTFSPIGYSALKLTGWSSSRIQACVNSCTDCSPASFAVLTDSTRLPLDAPQVEFSILP